MPSSLQSQIYKELRRLLVQARIDAGLTQADLADRLGHGQSYISKWERGQRYLDVAQFVQLCDAIGVSAADVLSDIRISNPTISESLSS